MDDLISRQAAIYKIESHIRTAEEPYQLTQTDRVLNHAFEIAANCVYNLPSAQPELSDEEKRLYKKLRSYHNGSYAKLLDKMMASAQQWIPCSERLPEKKQHVLVTVADEVSPYTSGDDWTGTDFWAYDNVIAWMPYPEPWKGEQP